MFIDDKRLYKLKTPSTTIKMNAGYSKRRSHMAPCASFDCVLIVAFMVLFFTPVNTLPFRKL
jgi:hypothetical protein